MSHSLIQKMWHHGLFHVLAVFLFVRLAGAVVRNERPTIGILTQPYGLTSGAKDNLTYIAASYVKFVESAGARVVPLHYDATDEELRALFGQINGILFAGGGCEIRRYPGNRYREAAQLLFQLALDANVASDAFPIHGTCLGFQMLGIMAAKNDSALCKTCFQGMNGQPLPLQFTPAAKNSQVFKDMPPALFDALGTQNITLNSHVDGITPESFLSFDELGSFFDVLSTNVDSDGRPFVSTFEARLFPFTGTQWHPEKNNFEWGLSSFPHSLEAVQASQYMANLFVERARQSSHRFHSPIAEDSALIYNYAPKFDPDGYFTQTYIFSRESYSDKALLV